MLVKPIIPNEEYKQRLDKIRVLLQQENVNGLFITPGVNFRYLLKSSAELRERLTVAVITPENSMALICPAFEVSNFVRSTPLTEEQVHPWEETENPYKFLKEVSHSLGADDGAVALTPETPFTIFAKMRDILPKVSFTDAYPYFKASRIVKTAKELELLRKANKATAEGIEATFDSLEVGMTEKQIATILEKELTSRSGESLQFAAVQTGENTAHPHGLPSNKKLQNNEVVLIDAGTSVEGYNGDITNTTFFGKPTEEFLKVYSLVEEAQNRAVKAAKASAIPEEVDAEARGYLGSAGYGDFFTHRTGHGLGLEVHEDPYIVKGNRTPLVLNNVFSIEPGVYMPDKFGVRIEDIVIAGKTSGERTCNPIRRYWEKQ